MKKSENLQSNCIDSLVTSVVIKLITLLQDTNINDSIVQYGQKHKL